MLFYKELNRNIFFYSIGIIILHYLFHYFIFERAALSPDDYANFIQYKNSIPLNFLDFFEKYNDRPISYLVLNLIHNAFLGNPIYYSILLFFSSFLIIMFAFLFFNLITNNIKHSFILTILYDLFPNKLEIFHSSIFININLAISLYILTIVFYLIFYFQKNYFFLFFSYIFFLISIFWYEVGFFIPVFLFIYTFCNKSEKLNSKIIFYIFGLFAFIMFFYILFRLTGSFRFADTIEENNGKFINLSSVPYAIIEIFNSYFGRYNIRSIVYGLYVFFQIKLNILILILVFDLFFIFIFFKIIKNFVISRFNFKVLYFFIIFIILMTIPNILYGGFGGRHSVLPSLGVALILFYFLFYLKFKFRNYIYSFIVFILVLVSQGNMWSQVISLRIVNSVFETISENTISISNSENILYDIDSFKKNINYSLLNNLYNNFNTYYGAQLFEPWGLKSMVNIATNNSPINIFIASSPLIKKNNKIIFNTTIQTGYNQILNEKKLVSNIKSFIIDYNLVYRSGYNFGNRNK